MREDDVGSRLAVLRFTVVALLCLKDLDCLESHSELNSWVISNRLDLSAPVWARIAAPFPKWCGFQRPNGDVSLLGYYFGEGVSIRPGTIWGGGIESSATRYLVRFLYSLRMYLCHFQSLPMKL